VLGCHPTRGYEAVAPAKPPAHPSRRLEGSPRTCPDCRREGRCDRTRLLRGVGVHVDAALL